MSSEWDYINDEISTSEHTKDFSVQIMTANGIILLDNRNIIQAYIIEDIYSFCMTGKIKFYDLQGIAEYGPFTGVERIQFIFGNQEEEGSFEKRVVFDIYKIQKATGSLGIETESTPVFELIFTEPLFKRLTQQRFSKAYNYNNILITDIIQDILINICDLDEIELGDIEESKTKLRNFYIPYWTPAQALKWLISRANGKETGQPGYLLYQNTKGQDVNTVKVNIVTLEKLFRKESIAPNIMYLFEDPNPYYRNKITSWKKEGLDQMSYKDIAGGQRIGFNSLQKKILRSNFSYKDAFDNRFTVLGNKTLFYDLSEDIFKKNETQTPINPTIIDYTGINNDERLEAFNYSKFIKRYSLQQSVSIIVPGYEDRKAGDMIDIMWPTAVKDGTEVYNKNLSGNWLVKSVIWQYNPGSPPFTQKMVLLKNGYTRPDIDLYPATLKNTFA